MNPFAMWVRAGVQIAWAVAALIVAVSPGVATATPPVIAVLGDSLSAGYGLASGEGWVDLLQRKLAAEKFPHRVVNASISGDTTAGGRARIDQVMREHRPAIVVVELGGNDGLRGGSLEAMRENLRYIGAAVTKAGARLLLLGMQMPPNYGPAYTQRFAAIYADIAAESRSALVPFFLEGVGARIELFQPDRIHPSAAAQPRMLDNVWPHLKPLLRK